MERIHWGFLLSLLLGFIIGFMAGYQHCLDLKTTPVIHEEGRI
jgi:ABC-type nitrate/sulfonate/bicarbonate transport system permease component